MHTTEHWCAASSLERFHCGLNFRGFVAVYWCTARIAYYRAVIHGFAVIRSLNDLSHCIAVLDARFGRLFRRHAGKSEAALEKKQNRKEADAHNSIFTLMPNET